MKDLSRCAISQALIACMPSSSFGREVDLLLARFNDRSAAIVVVVSEDGGQVVVVALQLTYLLELVLRFFLQPDVLEQQGVQIVDQIIFSLDGHILGLQGFCLFEAHHLQRFTRIAKSWRGTAAIQRHMDNSPAITRMPKSIAMIVVVSSCSESLVSRM